LISSPGGGSFPGITINKSTGTVTLSGVIPVSGSWTYISGIFDSGTSTLKLISTMTFTPGSASYYNLEYGGNNPTITLSGTATVLNNFTMSSASTLYMNGGTINVGGNLSCISGGAPSSATTSIALNGSGFQSMSSAGGEFPNITVNKTDGVVTFASNVTTAATRNFTITSGRVTVTGTSALSTTALTVGAAGVLKMMGTGDLTLAGNVSNSGQIVIQSNQTCGGADDIQILSSSVGVQRTWSGTGSFTIYDATVRDQGGSAAITAYSSTSVSGNGGNWTFSGAACPVIPPAATLGTGIFRLGTGVVNLR
jgi:hypothetical protein